MKLIKLKSDNPKPGGIFLSPLIGYEFPLKDFGVKSKASFVMGVRLEYSSIKLYPFLIGVSYEYQKHNGADLYVSSNYLNSFTTTIHNVGVGTTIMLNKFLKTDFTLPFLDLEAVYMSVKSEVAPDYFVPEVKRVDNVFGASFGLGITVYIFDVHLTYKYAGDYTSFGLKTRIRFPLIKF